MIGQSTNGAESIKAFLDSIGGSAMKLSGPSPMSLTAPAKQAPKGDAVSQIAGSGEHHDVLGQIVGTLIKLLL